MATVGTQLYLGNTLINNSFLGDTASILNPFEFDNIITNNLLFYVNAGFSASYPGSGTTWNDLSGQTNTATLVNTPTFTSDGISSYFTFSNASNSYATTANTTSFGTNATFIAFINSAAAQSQFNGLLFSRTGGVANGMNMGSSNQLGYTWTNANFNWNSGLTIPNNEWCMVAITITATAANAYLYKASGTTTATNVVGHGSGGNINLNVAWDPFAATRSFNGRLNVAMCYNAALTQAELNQNYIALKQQIGL
jgi:hypothetical protein